ncbi:class I SAM-dependent methyltransferase [Streptomyces pactum]|uniref:Methyltransferase type 12 n=1 Tax=Streptomyces pactum TaxID=68249 RepID=A0A1S6J4Q1_9ACTN|nr:class I SAM-dependent methyltransferase [Streptomyces pactum]AQS66747.1 methyltransferase type 12 [Streptomyces pactum]
MNDVLTDEVLGGLPGVTDWQLVRGGGRDSLLVAGPSPGPRPPADAGRADADAAGRAADAGDASVRGTDPAPLAALMRQLDEAALLTMARVLDRTRLFRDAGRPHTDEILAALAVAPRHAWIVRRWLSTLTAEDRLRPAAATGRHHRLTAPDRRDHARALRDLEGACAGLGYPASMTRFFRAAAERLPLLLQDRTSLHEVLFPDGETDTAQGNYRDSVPSRWANHAAAALLAAEAGRRSERGPLRVLEAGAGVGGTTTAVLEALGDTPVDYLFTDVSPFFLRAAKEAFGDRPGVRYALFDIQADPHGQGLEPGSRDVVLAANVLHNARHAGRCLADLRELLAPDGLLVMIESCREHYQALTSMYLLMSPGPDEEGWFTDLRAGQDRVFLTAEEWTRQLDAAGFDPLPVLPHEAHPLAAAAGQRVIAGRVRAHGARPDPGRVRAALADRLPPSPGPPRVHSVDEIIHPTIPTGEPR